MGRRGSGAIVAVSTTPLIPWPLVVVLEDCYVPELAAPCLAHANELGDELLRIIIAANAHRCAEWLPCQLN